jgi:hypothetical protein
MKAIGVIFIGYPDLPHTDLFAPYYDSVSTRRLWNNAAKRLNMKETMNSVLVLNAYFRWYPATYELFRKMLIFDCYCLGLYTGREVNVRNYLFRMNDPAKNLNFSGSKKRKALIEYYDSSIRHTISHGNIIIIPNNCVVLRETDADKENVIESKYANADKFISRFSKNIEIMYGAVRLFHFILSYLIGKYGGVFEKYIGKVFTDEVLIAMVRSIQADPNNPVF